MSTKVRACGVQRGERSPAEVLVEVGEVAADVRKAPAGLEGRTALVIDEHEVEGLRRAAEGQRGDEGLQELALARAGGAADQHVRPLPGDVEGEQSVARKPSEWHCGCPPAA